MSVTSELHELGNGLFAYTQLPGSWGWSNSGLIVDGDQTLLVDTLFDKRLTTEMLTAMRRAAPAAERIGAVVNTHGNGDHCYGNSVVSGAEIIGSRGCRDDLANAPPSRNHTLMRAGRLVLSLGPMGRVLGRAAGAVGLHTLSWLADAAPLAIPLFEDFEFGDNEVVLPSHIFEDTLTLTVGDKTVELIEVGPAHTLGDTVVHVPGDRTLFTGDILFKDSHPLVWEGPVSNWIRACRTLLELDVETVVPGHGPVTDLGGIRETMDYLTVLNEESRARYDAGMSVDEAARDIALDAWRGWLDPERIYINVHTLYRDFSGDRRAPEALEMFAGMGRLVREWG